MCPLFLNRRSYNIPGRADRLSYRAILYRADKLSYLANARCVHLSARPGVL